MGSSSNTVGLSFDELSEQFLSVSTPPCTELFVSSQKEVTEIRDDDGSSINNDGYQLQPLFQLLSEVGIVPPTTIVGSISKITPLSNSDTNTNVNHVSSILETTKTTTNDTAMNNLQKIYVLVQNRSWLDVHVLVEQLLHGSSIQHGSPTNTLHLAPIFTSLLLLSYQQQQQNKSSTDFAASGNNNSNNNNSGGGGGTSSSGSHNELSIVPLDSHKIELVFVMMVHICALIKLRYYTKLQNDIETWTFCFHHHHNIQKRLEWIPWNLDIMAASSLFYYTNNHTNQNGINHSTSTAKTTENTISNDTNTNDTSTMNAMDELWKIRSAILSDFRNSTNSNVNNKNKANDGNTPTSSTTGMATTNNNDISISLSASIALIQVENALANIFILTKEWRMALQCYERMMDWTNIQDSSSATLNEIVPSSASSSTGFLKRLCLEEVRRYHHHHHSSLQQRTRTIPSSFSSSDNIGLVQLIQAACRFELYSRQGRILLQAGAIPEAECVYNQAKMMWESEVIRYKTTNDVSQQQQQQYLPYHFVSIQIVSIQLYINYGLLEFSKTNFSNAMYYFQKAMEMIRLLRGASTSAASSSSSSSSSMFSDTWIEDSITKVPLPLLVLSLSSQYFIGAASSISNTKESSSVSSSASVGGMTTATVTAPNSSNNNNNTISYSNTTSSSSSCLNNEWIHTLYSETMNNISLCYLYTCRLRDSIYCMECLIREHPTLYCTERIVLNLCTLYELKYDTYHSTICKKIIHYICTTKYHFNDISNDCYRIA